MYQNFDMEKAVPEDRAGSSPKLYTVQEGFPGDVAFPNADAGKERLYGAQPGTFYSTAGFSVKNRDTAGKHDVGAGMPKGSPYAPAESHEAAFDNQGMGGRQEHAMPRSVYEGRTKQPRSPKNPKRGF